MSEQRPWHRLFGLTWTDFCAGSGLTVSPEKDLSLKQQFLDLLLIREEGGTLPQPLPDGFDNLATYNILTFKSHREALTDWALEELIGHYVNYRKQTSPELDDLLPASDFRLYAVCVRFPLDLSREVNLVPLGEGVYELRCITRWLRIIVVQELAREARNAMLHLFSSRLEQVEYGQEHYKPRTQDMTTLFYDLLNLYTEDSTMSEALKEYARKRIKELLRVVPVEERLEGITPEQRLEGITPEQRLEGITPEQRLEGITPEKRLEGITPEKRLEGLSAEEVVKALSPEELRAVVEAAQRRLHGNGSSNQAP